MPIRRCAVCKRVQTIPLMQKHYLIVNDELVCSKKCVLDWIQRPRPRFSTEDVYKIRRDIAVVGEYRSKYEKYFHLWLEEEHKVVAYYEPYTFKVGNGFYTPDFFLPKYGCFLETKGNWGIGQRKKLSRFRSQYPDVSLLVVSWLLQDSFYEEHENDLELK